jgi:hypothetical protein
MASFIQGLTDVNSAPQLFTPDYNFLRYTLGKREQNYQQGLSQVSSAYNFLNSPLSSPINQQRRDQYLKNAQQQLQTISSSDLSQQQNVAAANDVFAPMVNDKSFLFDAKATSDNRKQLADMEEWRDSPDIEQRKRFNQDIYNYVQSDLDSIKNDKTGDISKYRYEGRKAHAYTDPLEILQKAAKDQGFKIVTDVDGGQYIYKITDGPDHKQNYEEFARNVLSGDTAFQYQTGILAKAYDENLIKKARLIPENANKTDDQIRKDYAVNRFDQLRKNNLDYLNNLKKPMDALGADINTFLTANQDKISKQLPAWEDLYKELNLKQQKFELLKKEYDLNTSSFTGKFGDIDASGEAVAKKKDEYGNNFMKNSVSEFFNQYSNDAVTRFSNVRSAGGSKEIKENKAYFDAYRVLNQSQNTLDNFVTKEQGLAVKQEDEARKEELLKLKEAETFAKINKLTGATGGTKGDGTGSGEKKSEILYEGASATQIEKIDAYEALKNKIEMTASKALSVLTEQDGGVINVLSNWGVDPKYIPQIREVFKKAYSSGPDKDPNAKWTAADKEAMNGVFSGILRWAKANGKQSLVDEMNKEYGEKGGPETFDFHKIMDIGMASIKYDDNIDINKKYIQQWEDYKNYSTELKASKAPFEAAEKALVSSIKNSKNSSYSDLLNKDKTGFLTETDIKNQLIKNKELLKAYNYGKIISDDEIEKIAKGYFDNSLVINHKIGVTYSTNNATQKWHQAIGTANKTAYNIKLSSPYDSSGHDDYNIPIEFFNNNTPKEYANLKKEAQDHVDLPGETIQYLKNNALKASPAFYPGKANEQDYLKMLSIPTLTNAIAYYNDGNSFVPLDPTGMEHVKNALVDPKRVIEGSMVIYPYSSTTKGMAIQVQLAAGDKKDTDAAAKGTFLFPINIDKTTPEKLKVFDISNEIDRYRNIASKPNGDYQTILNYEGLGIKVQIQPDGKNSQVGNIRILTQEYDPVKGVYKQEFTPVNLESKGAHRYNMDATTYDDFEKGLKSLAEQYIDNRAQVEGTIRKMAETKKTPVNFPEYLFKRR